MLQNNKAFFFPTLMVYIIIFLMLLSFMVYNNLSNKLMLQSFEDEIYYELALIKSKEYVKDYTSSGNFKKNCKQEKFKEDVGNAYLEIEGICTLSMFGDFYEKFEENILTDSQEITSAQYKEQLKFVKDFNEYQQTLLDPNFIEENFEKIMNFIIRKIPEGEKIEDTLDRLSNIINEYIIFDIEFKTKKKISEKEGIMIFYDYKEGESKMLLHT